MVKVTFHTRVVAILVIILLLNIVTLYLYYIDFNYNQFAIKPNPECFDQYGQVFDSQPFYSKLHKNLSTKYHQAVIPGEKLINFDREIYNSHTWLRRAISFKVKNQLMELLASFLAMLDKEDISYVMSQGMLLGSYLFHDLIPWDDDLDLFIDIKDVNKLRALFRTNEFSSKYGVHSFHEVGDINMYSQEVLEEDIPLNNIFSCGKHRDPKSKCYQVGKIFPLSGSRAGGQEWNFPFVDFFFIQNNGTHVYNLENWDVINPIIIKVEDFYPFTLRPFNKFWIPAPRNARKFLSSHYKDFRCLQSSWDHVNERMTYIHTMFAQKAPCHMLTSCYGHVQRRPLLDKMGSVVQGQMIEELVLGDIILQSVIVNNTFVSRDKLNFD